MNRKRNRFQALYVFFLAVTVLLSAAPTFSQTPAPGTPAPNQQPAEQVPGLNQLTAYQKSQLLQTYSDWALLAKFREADKLLPPPWPSETRVVFMGDSITEGWGMKATATSPARGEFFPGKPY